VLPPNVFVSIESHAASCDVCVVSCWSVSGPCSWSLLVLETSYCFKVY